VNATSAGRTPRITSVAPAPQEQLLQQLVETGRSLLDGLAAALGKPGDPSRGGASLDSASPIRIESEPGSGQRILKIPLPSEQTLGRALVWLQALSGALTPASK
jgi:hypothetical protein